MIIKKNFKFIIIFINFLLITTSCSGDPIKKDSIELPEFMDKYYKTIDINKDNFNDYFEISKQRVYWIENDDEDKAQYYENYVIVAKDRNPNYQFPCEDNNDFTCSYIEPYVRISFSCLHDEKTYDSKSREYLFPGEFDGKTINREEYIYFNNYKTNDINGKPIYAYCNIIAYEQFEGDVATFKGPISCWSVNNTILLNSDLINIGYNDIRPEDSDHYLLKSNNIHIKYLDIPDDDWKDYGEGECIPISYNNSIIKLYKKGYFDIDGNQYLDPVDDPNYSYADIDDYFISHLAEIADSVISQSNDK